MRITALLLVCCFALLSAGCGSDSHSESELAARQSAAREARIAAERQRQRQRIREAHRAARARHEAARRKAASECDPNYSGACLDPYASDYDCEGGSGNGPEYTGPVTVVGEDHYGLDSDNDGYACE